MIEDITDTPSGRTCEAVLRDAFGTPYKQCGAEIVEERQWKHRDINRDEFLWVCTQGHPQEAL